MAVLLASIALYCAAKIIESVWPVLLIVTGAIALLWAAIVAIRMWLARRY